MTIRQKCVSFTIYLVAIFNSSALFADVEVVLSVTDACDVEHSFSEGTSPPPTCPAGYDVGQLSIDDNLTERNNCTKAYSPAETTYIVTGVEVCPSTQADIEALVASELTALSGICEAPYDFENGWTLSNSGDHISVNSATCKVIGPEEPEVTSEGIQATNDKRQTNASQGQIVLNVLNNDSRNVHITSVDGNVFGQVAAINNGRDIAYVPPQNLTKTIVERFNYSIVDNSDNSLKARASVELTVVANAAPTGVPTSSIGKIRSDLPVARAVENLCDLLTFRANQSSSPSLSAAQQDLQSCACAIVNEGDVGAQRNAINQLSGGQHQFSDTVMRFAKGNSNVILRRMTQLRKLVTSNKSQRNDPIVSNNILARLEAELPRHYPVPVNGESYPAQPFTRDNSRDDALDPRRDIMQNARQDTQNAPQTGNAHALNHSVFDNLSLGRNSLYFSTALGGSAGDGESGLFGDQVGVFTSITTGQGDNDESEFSFDFDSFDITTGIDYTRPGTDRTRIYGGALSIGKVETDANNGGSTDSDSVGITLYGTLFGTDGWFGDVSLSYSQSDIDIERVVDFTASGKTVFQTSNGDTEGDELGLSIGGGKEINMGANNLRLDARLRYIDGSIDGLTERIGEVGANGSGLALQTDDFDIESFRSELGLQYNHTFGTSFGVVIPYVGVNWIHEFEDRGSDIRARFVVDAHSDGFNQLEEDAPGGSNRPTLFVIPGAENDSDYAQLSLGSSFTFKGGKSAWLSLTSIAGLSGINSEQVSAGIRWELGN